MKRLALCLSLLVVSCGDTALERIEFPLRGAGVGTTTATTDAGWELELTRADVALGPVYFCATEGASMEFCESAVADFPAAGVIDGLDPSPQALGPARGVTDTVRSAFFDYGIAYLLTDNAPRPLEGATTGHSLVIEGSARRGMDEVAFEAEVDLEAMRAGNAVVTGLQTEQALVDGNVRVTAVVDPVAWALGLDFDRLAEDAPADGAPVHLEPGTQGYEALVVGMTNRDLPTFEWSQGAGAEATGGEG